MRKMKLKKGCVSIFGLINNKEKDIKIYIDKTLTTKKIINFHPNDNTATIFIKTNDMFNFLDNLKFNYQTIDL